MGYKTACILVDYGVGPGGLGKPLEFDPDATQTLAGLLGMTCPDDPEYTHLGEAWYPRENRQCLAVFREGAAVIGGMDWVQPFIEEPGHQGNSELKDKVLNAFPDADIAVLALHSVVNFWAYVVYEHGEFRRARAGSADDGTWLEKGDPLPEERTPLLNLDDSKWENDRRVWPRAGIPEEEWERDDTLGESFVFAVASRWIGASYDSSSPEVDHFENNSAWLLPVEIETVWVERKPWWRKLFGRGK